MLYLSNKLHKTPIFSIRQAGRIGIATKPVINPHNLHIDGFCCQVHYSKKELILLDMQIRDYSAKGIIIDDHEKLSEPSELPRLTPILNINYQLPGKIVFSSGKKIGKVVDYAFDNNSLFIQKLYVQPAIWQGLGQQNLTIDRSSIIEVTDSKIIIKGGEQKISEAEDAKSDTVPAAYSASNSFISE